MAKETPVVDDGVTQPDQAQEEADAFVPEPREPADPFWVAVPLSMAGTVRLLRLLTGILSDTVAVGRLREVVEGDEAGGEQARSAAMVLFEVVNEENLARLLSIIVDRTPAEVVVNYRFGPALAALIDFWVMEDLGRWLGEATRLSRMGQPSNATAPAG